MKKAQILAELDELTDKSGMAPVLPVPLVKSIVNLNDEIEYVEIELSAEDLQNGYIDGITLMPSAGVGKYHDFVKIIPEIHPGSNGETPFAYEHVFMMLGRDLNTDKAEAFIDRSFINSTSKAALIITQLRKANLWGTGVGELDVWNGYGISNSQGLCMPIQEDKPLLFYGFEQEEPIAFEGDGKILFKIWYSVRTFGSDLPIEE